MTDDILPTAADPAGYDVFLSYRRSDREATTRIRQWLESRGKRVFMDKELAAGFPWVQPLERALEESRAVAVLVGPTGFGNWQRREIDWALNRQTREGGRRFPVLPVLLPQSQKPDRTGFLSLNTWIDLRDGLSEAGLSQLLFALGGPGEKTRVGAECPYRGLTAFTEDDGPWFEGRREQTEELFQAIRSQSLIALVAPSGSGKSSLVRAGLTPLLRRQKPPDITWEVAIARPGDRPFRFIAEALMPLLEPDASRAARLEGAGHLENALRTGGIPEAVEQALQASGRADRLLLAIDQFEEMFTLTPAEQRAACLDELLRAVKSARLHLLLVVRADFYGQAIASHRALSDALQSRVSNLAPMRPAELRDAIRRPAERAGLVFEAGLADEILEDVEAEPGNLPLLQFALTQLWNERRDNLLTHDGYAKNGKLRGSIAHRADDFMSRAGAERDTVQRLMTRLVRVAHPGEDSGDTRRRVRVRDLGPGEAEMAQRLANERLLVTDGDGREETVEIAHEALIRHWETLRGWLNSDREFLLWRQRFDAVATQWLAAGRAPADLPRGHLLEEAENWRRDKSEALTAEERNCIDAAVAVRARERRNKTRLLALAAALPVLAIGLAVTAWLGFRQTALASSRELAASSRQYLDSHNTDHSIPLFLALQALRAADTTEAREALHQAVQTVGKAAIEGDGAVTAIAFDPGGKVLATGADDGAVQLRPGDRWETVLATIQHGARVASIAFAPGGTRVATAGGRTAKLWDVPSGAERRTFLHDCADVMAMVFAAAGERLITGCNDPGALTVWNVGDGMALAKISVGAGIRGMAADPKSERFGLALADHSIRLWDGRQNHEIRKFEGAQDSMETVAIHPGGRQIAGGARNGEAIVWDIESGRILWRRRPGPTALASVAYSPDGRYLLASNLAGRGIVWDAAGGEAVITLESPNDPAPEPAAAFDPAAPSLSPRAVLATGSGVRVYELGLDRLRNRARSLLTRKFTDDDCVQYLRRHGCELNP